MTTKKNILFFIPLGLVTLLLLYSWSLFLLTDYIATFSHYLGLSLFAPIVYSLFKDKTFKRSVVLLGVYLVLATINLLSFLPFVFTSSFGISFGTIKIWTPVFNGSAFILLIVYSFLNFDTLVAIYLDYKEARGKL